MNARSWSRGMALLVLLVLSGVETRGQNAPVIYRMNQWEEAKKRAVAQQKPIAWIATIPKYLAPARDLQGKGSHAATAYAIRALQNDAVLVVSDAFADNHHEPNIISMALHAPKMHYDVPNVILLTPEMDLVLCKAPYTPDGQERIKIYTEVLKKIRDKDSWYKKRSKDAAGTNSLAQKEKPGSQ